MIAAEDIGRCALGVFQRGQVTVGETVDTVGDQLTGYSLAQQLSVTLGEPVVYRPATLEQYRSFGFPGAGELANQFQYFSSLTREYAETRERSSKKINPPLQSFIDWLPSHVASIPVSPRSQA